MQWLSGEIIAVWPKNAMENVSLSDEPRPTVRHLWQLRKMHQTTDRILDSQKPQRLCGAIGCDALQLGGFLASDRHRKTDHSLFRSIGLSENRYSFQNTSLGLVVRIQRRRQAVEHVLLSRALPLLIDQECCQWTFSDFIVRLFIPLPEPLCPVLHKRWQGRPAFFECLRLRHRLDDPLSHFSGGVMNPFLPQNPGAQCVQQAGTDSQLHTLPPSSRETVNVQTILICCHPRRTAIHSYSIVFDYSNPESNARDSQSLWSFEVVDLLSRFR